MKKKIFLILTVLWTGFIFFNSAQSGDESSAMSGFFADIARNVLNAVGLGGVDMDTLSYAVRKAAHFTEFFVQSALLSAFALTVRREYRYTVIYVLFAGLFTACCDELLQLFIDGRGSAVKDVFIDFSGTAAAAALVYPARVLKKRFTKARK